MCACSGDMVGGGFVEILKAELNMLQSCICQFNHALLIESETRGDHVDVEPSITASTDQLRQIFAGERFATRQMKMDNPQCCSLVKGTFPVVGRKLFRCKLQF